MGPTRAARRTGMYTATIAVTLIDVNLKDIEPRNRPSRARDVATGQSAFARRATADNLRVACQP